MDIDTLSPLYKRYWNDARAGRSVVCVFDLISILSHFLLSSLDLTLFLSFSISFPSVSPTKEIKVVSAARRSSMSSSCGSIGYYSSSPTLSSSPPVLCNPKSGKKSPLLCSNIPHTSTNLGISA